MPVIGSSALVERRPRLAGLAFLSKALKGLTGAPGTGVVTIAGTAAGGPARPLVRPHKGVAIAVPRRGKPEGAIG